MTRLIISQFSCIDEADISIGNLTLVIGPQASGKSVIAKLIYFFHDVILTQYQHIQQTKSVEEFKTDISESFKKSFPCASWGNKKFVIKFEIGSFTIEITRPSVAQTRKEKLLISFNDSFLNQYDEILNELEQAIEKRSQEKTKDQLDLEILHLYLHSPIQIHHFDQLNI